MKIFEMIIDDGNNVYKVTRPAYNIAHLKNTYAGNGKFIIIKDVSEKYPIDIKKLKDTLILNQWGQIETEIICSLIQTFLSK